MRILQIFLAFILASSCNPALDKSNMASWTHFSIDVDGNGRGDWEIRKWPFTPVPKASYGRSTRSWLDDLDKDGDVEGTGSFHSLGLADFDLDGDLDIFAGEQEDPDTYMEADGLLAMKPPGLKERGVIWENDGESPPHFTPVVINTDNPGWHDASLGDVDGDGDIDIATKVWNADGPNYHADYWRNDIVK